MKSFITSVLKSKIFKGAAAAVFWLAAWQLLYFGVGSDILIASPLTVLKTLLDFIQKGEFWASVGLSLVRIFAGFLVGTAAGVLIAVLCSKVKIADLLLSPVLRVIRATPVVSFIILAWVWLARGFIPVFITFLMVMPIVWEGVYTGISQIPKGYLELAAVYKLGFGKRLFKIYIPSVLPFFRGAAVTALGLAWKSGIAAEVIVQPVFSIGSGLYDAKIYLETGEMFAWTTVVIIFSVILEKALSRLLKKIKAGEKNG